MEGAGGAQAMRHLPELPHPSSGSGRGSVGVMGRAEGREGGGGGHGDSGGQQGAPYPCQERREAGGRRQEAEESPITEFANGSSEGCPFFCTAAALDQRRVVKYCGFPLASVACAAATMTRERL